MPFHILGNLPGTFFSLIIKKTKVFLNTGDIHFKDIGPKGTSLKEWK